MSGSLHKLVILCYKDKEFKDEIKDAKFTAPINPESFTRNIKMEMETKSATGSAGKDPKFKGVGNEELKLDFILDGTGTMEGYIGAKDKDGKDVSVHDALDKFINCVSYNGDVHRPRFLVVFWGSEIKFPCVLSSLDINHTLFDPQGFPIRVKITATFLKYATPASQLAIDKISSPDLTHYKKVTAADRLDLLTYKIYNNSKYFLQVASVNNLSNLRNIKPGTNIYFPPFDKKANNG